MEAIGEVLTSSITGLVAECWQPGDDQADLRPLRTPRFGSFVRIDSADSSASGFTGLNIYAVVYDVITGPQDAVHRPHALRMTREQLRIEQPQIFALLKTEFHAAIVGYERLENYRPGLPPQPPQVHDFVYIADSKEIEAITEDLDFLRLVARVSSVPSDELIAAAIREACKARNNDYDFLVRAGQSLTQTFREDYDRLSAMLRKIRPH